MTVRPEPPPLLTSHDIDRMIAELLAAGWEPKRPTLWRSPRGSLHAGPAGAWRTMMAAKTACSCWVGRNDPGGSSDEREACHVHGLRAENRQLRADVARLTEENTRLGIENEEDLDDVKSARAERDALRQGIARFRTWLIGDAAEWDGLFRTLHQLDTLLPPDEATT